MKPFETKAIFAWQMESTENGDPTQIADLLKLAGFEAVYIKATDGPYVFKVNGKENLTLELVNALRAKGIAVIGWGFNYGINPTGEASLALAQVNRFDLDGWIWDVESRFESTGSPVRNALDMISIFRGGVNKPTPLAFCSWAYWKSRFNGQEIHPIDMASAFMQGCDYGMPMEYWNGLDAGPVSYFTLSLEQWKTITDKPIIPVGRAYNGDNGDATVPDMQSFEKAVRLAGCLGISWWELDQTQPKYHPDWWKALSEMQGFAGSITPPSPDPLPNPGGKMQYKVIWTKGANVRPTPSTANAAIRTLDLGAIVDVLEDGVLDADEPTNINKRWVRLSDGYAASDYPDSANVPQQRMQKVSEPLPIPPSESVTLDLALNINGSLYKALGVSLVKQP